MPKPKTCPDCRRQVRQWNKECAGCGFTLVLEPEEAARARFLRGPSLGAMLFTQGWAFGARLYLFFVLSLIPVVGFAALIICLFFGRRLSWQQGGWNSWEEYKRRMRLLDVLGVVWIGLLLVAYLFAREG